MSYNNSGYGGRANPYAQQNTSYDAPIGGGSNYGQAPQQYGGNPYGGARPAMGRNEYGAENVEMEPLTGRQQNFGQAQNDPNFILNECNSVDQNITEIQGLLSKLDQAQRRTLTDTDTSMNSASKQTVERTNNEVLACFREITGQIKRIKSRPEAGQPRNAPQIGRVTRRLKDVRQAYQSSRHQFENATRDQAKKQARIVMEHATEAEINAFVDDPSNTQVFSRALMQSNRRGDAQTTLGAVSARHAEIQKIERQMIELAELFQEMESMVVQQEAMVTNIEQKGEEVQDNLYKGNEQISTAIVSARSRNRKKWWCLLIVVIIIAIIVIVVVIYTQVINKPKAAKRSLEYLNSLMSDRAVIPGKDWIPSERAILPGVPFVGEGDARVPVAFDA